MLFQGGDRTGTGEVSDSIYGRPFPHEFESRLEFRIRGCVAFAGHGDDPSKDTNGSQFFITLTPQDQLTKKYTLFGVVILLVLIKGSPVMEH